MGNSGGQATKGLHLLSLPELGFESLSVGHVADDPLLSDNTSVISPPQGRSEQAVHLCPILLTKLRLKVSNRSLLFYLLLTPALAITMQTHLFDVQTHHLFSLIAKEVEEKLVDVNKPALPVGHIDRISGFLEKGTVSLLTLLQRLLRLLAFSYLLFLRLIPVFPFWLVNLAPGLLGVPFWTYVTTTFIGIIPGTFAFALAGNGLDSVFDAQQASYESCLAKVGEGGHDSCVYGIDPGALLTTDVIVAIVALGVVALIPVVAKKRRRRAV